jgi:hypothetical protein
MRFRLGVLLIGEQQKSILKIAVSIGRIIISIACQFHTRPGLVSHGHHGSDALEPRLAIRRLSRHYGVGVLQGFLSMPASGFEIAQ